MIKSGVWEFIREDEEEIVPERDDHVCDCILCGEPIFYGDEAVGIVDRGTAMVICEDCAAEKHSLTEWLDALRLDYYEGEAGRTERWTRGEIDRQAQRLVLLMEKTGGDNEQKV